MNRALLLLLACSFALPLAAQQPTSSQTIQMECRDMAAGGEYLGPNETVINGRACHPIQPAQVTTQAERTDFKGGSVPGPTPTAPGVITGAETQPVSPASTVSSPTASQPLAGARVAIAPMGGFETYFAAAVREKKVPVTITLNKDTAQYFVVSTETEWQGWVYGSGGSASWNQNGGSAAHGSAGGSTRGLEASIMLIDAQTKDVVWAYEVHKSSHGALIFGTAAARGQQSVAEACAKHLKDFIEKGK